MPAFSYRNRVAFHETDAAGIVHFSNIFRMAEEAETHAMASVGFRLDAYAYPRVHAEADYMAPLRFWDEYEVQAGLEKIGATSLHWRFEVRCQGKTCAILRYISARRHVKDNSSAPYSETEKSMLQNLILPPIPKEN